MRCLIAGGGTGGHLFPGIAVAREVATRYPDAHIRFVVGHGRMESEILARYGYSVASIDVEGLKGRGVKKGMSVMVRLPKSIFQSAAILRKFAPYWVLGVGGYSAGPVCLAARLMGIPTAIHEQNSFPGLTNRLLSRVVSKVLVSFEESRGHFKREKVVLTGNPVRRELLSTPEGQDKGVGDFTILVVGGSQGARAVNIAVAGALDVLKDGGEYPRVIHQTGELDHDRVVEDYRRRGIKGEIVPFIQDMAAAYGRADLVVSRAGATTIFELAALGKPSILIPYPYAANQHQEINATCLAAGGGAIMIPQRALTGEALAEVLTRYISDPRALQAMGRAALKMARPDAAARIVDELMEMAG